MATLISLREQVTDITRDPNYRIRPLAILDRAINSAYKTIQQELEWFIDSSNNSYTITLVNWTQEHTLPTDFLVMQQVRRSNWTAIQPLLLTTKKNIQEQYTPSSNGTPCYYYINWNSVGVYPTPSNWWSLLLNYTSLQATITTSVDSTNPSILDDAIVYKAAAILFRQVQKLDEAKIREVESIKETDLARFTLRKDENYRYDLHGYPYLTDYNPLSFY